MAPLTMMERRKMEKRVRLSLLKNPKQEQKNDLREYQRSYDNESNYK
jgi:hypothetical protein